MPFLTDFSTADLTAIYNAAARKAVKPGSYPKAKLVQLIQSTNGWEAALTTEQHDWLFGMARVPYNHELGGTDTGEPIPAEQPITTSESETFTLSLICAELGVSTKVARQRLRKHQGKLDTETRYVFHKSTWQTIADIITPKTQR